MKKHTTLALSLVLLLAVLTLALHPELRAQVREWLPEDAPTGIVLLLLVLLISRPGASESATAVSASR